MAEKPGNGNGSANGDVQSAMLDVLKAIHRSMEATLVEVRDDLRGLRGDLRELRLDWREFRLDLRESRYELHDATGLPNRLTGTR